MPAIQAMPAKAKIIAPPKPAVAAMLVFWFFVFALPALICKVAFGVYIQSANAQAFINDSEGLRTETERFIHDLKAENRLLAAFTSTKKHLEAADMPASELIEPASLSRHIASLFASNNSPVPVFCGLTNLSNRQTGGYSQPGSLINPGRRSLEIIMTHLYPVSSVKNAENEKRYQPIRKTVFGSFLEPSARPGVLQSGLYIRGKADRLFIVHDTFVNRSDNTRFACLLVFSENSFSLKNLLQHARLKPTTPEFTRGYAILPVLPDREFMRTQDNRVFFATPIEPSVLRVGSHAGKSWYDAVLNDGSAMIKPSKLPFMVVSKNSQTTYSAYLSYQTFISLVLLSFVFSGLGVTRQILAGSLYPAPLQQRFKLAILAATLMPFTAFFFTADEFTEHFSRITVSSQMQNIVNDLQMLEQNLLNHDLRERQTTSKFVAEMHAHRMDDAEALTRLLKSQMGKLYEGYTLLRSDGIYLDELPDLSDVSTADCNKLQIAKDINFSQLYSIFSVTGTLRAEFADNAGKKPEFLKWKALSQHFNGIDRDTFCRDDGNYVLAKNAEKNYFRLSFHTLFPESDKSELWAGLTLIKNARSSAEKFLIDQSNANMALKKHGELTTHSAVFRCHEDGSGLDPNFAWPASAKKDQDLLMAAGRLNENQREASWLQHDKLGLITIFAAKAMSELPFILVSRCLISLSALNERMFQLAAILLIPYAMLLIAILSSLLADIFLRPIKLLLEGVSMLENGNYPTLKDSSDNELGTLIRHFNIMSQGMQQRRLLQRFISDEVSSSISEEAAGMHESAGSLVFRTIMFIHIRDFSALSEQIPPEQAIKLLNHYFTAMEPCLNKFNGQIDKYIGDAIMLSFSRENCDDCPEIAACHAALSCMATVPGLNRKLASDGLPQIIIGAGIACGQVIRGKIGARHSRQDYTLIGDPVNLAARLEAVSHFDARPHILIDSKVEAATKKALTVNFHAQLAIKGKAEPVSVYELSGNNHAKS